MLNSQFHTAAILTESIFLNLHTSELVNPL